MVVGGGGGGGGVVISTGQVWTEVTLTTCH